jgi:hypothetical protein
MQRLICSLVTVASLVTPSSALAQNYGGGYYPPTHNHHWQQNQFGGDTVIYNGRILTNNLPPNTDTCGWVHSQGLSCQYDRWDGRTRTHYVRSIPYSRYSNPGWQYNNQQRRHPRPIWQNNSGCVYQDKHIRILCN